MATTAHKAATPAKAQHAHPNYMAIFWWLAILTVIELAVVFMPLSKLTIGVLLCALAVGKAALVAMYFMHLKFETRSLGLVAVTPLAIATLLVFLLLPDGFAVSHTTAEKKPAPAAGKH
jgi:cytochrome c oxidase subunit 4